MGRHTHKRYILRKGRRGFCRVQRRDSVRLVNPASECNRLADRIEELEANVEGHSRNLKTMRWWMRWRICPDFLTGIGTTSRAVFINQNLNQLFRRMNSAPCWLPFCPTPTYWRTTMSRFCEFCQIEHSSNSCFHPGAGKLRAAESRIEELEAAIKRARNLC